MQIKEKYLQGLEARGTGKVKKVQKSNFNKRDHIVFVGLFLKEAKIFKLMEHRWRRKPFYMRRNLCMQLFMLQMDDLIDGSTGKNNNVNACFKKIIF